MNIEANLVDIHSCDIYPASIEIEDGVITSITPNNKEYSTYILPGFVDAHIHIESSMLPPYEFSRLAIPHGTVATVSDPHEIANVLGIEGVEFMIENASKTPLKVLFGASPCVPATPFETSGATLTPKDIEYLLSKDGIGYLSEVMNFPAVVADDKDMLTKIEIAKRAKVPIDGHAPALSGEDLKKYIDAGISTDHEAFTLKEAKEKISLGMKILIREGSAAKNFEALHPLIATDADMVMFCSDDRHPDDLAKGHINELVKRSLGLGYDLFDVLKIASYNPVKHYNLSVGLLRVGDRADFIEIDNLKEFNILKVFIDGNLVAKESKSLLPYIKSDTPNNFNTLPKSADDFYLPECKEMEVIQALDHQLMTYEKILTPNESSDVLKIAVINRYENTPIKGIAHISGFGLRYGAIASSVAHDSHNIVVVGYSDKEMAEAANLIIENRGGVAAVGKNRSYILPLGIAGIMSTLEAYEVAKRYQEIDFFVKEELGSSLSAPFMTLSFMALLVIPEIKLSDKGLFDGREFHFISPCKSY